MNKIDNGNFPTGINLRINIIKEVDDDHLERQNINSLRRQIFNLVSILWRNVISKTAFISAGHDSRKMNVKFTIVLFNKTQGACYRRRALSERLPIKFTNKARHEDSFCREDINKICKSPAVFSNEYEGFN